MMKPKWNGCYGKFPILMIDPHKKNEINSISWYVVFGFSLENIIAYKKISEPVSFF